MGQLIDDLLAFSRLGRQGMRIAEIDISRMAHQVLSDLQQDAPDRSIEFRVGGLPAASGDPVLIRQALWNLIGNAIKHTCPIDRAAIEVEGRDSGGEHIYCVRDNGVRFDMKKLFSVFERLNSPEEFEGRRRRS